METPEPNKDERANVAGAHLVGLQCFHTGADDLILGEWNGESEDFGRIEQTVHMVRKSKDRRAGARTLIGPDPLENPKAVMQRMGQDVHVRLFPGRHHAVHPDKISP